MPETVRVEVAYAEPHRQFLRALDIAAGSTLAFALEACNLAEEFNIDVSVLDAGIWSKPVTRDTVLSDGDRVELYRPLQVDPKDARRARAASRKR